MDGMRLRDLDDRLNRIEEQNTKRFQELLAQIQRRDKWIITSICNLVGLFNYLLVVIGVWFFIEKTGAGLLGSIDIIGLGIVALFLMAHCTSRLAEAYSVKIERGATLSCWLRHVH
ncbi:hypothetical protein [Novosphingobium olei]|uniref:Uncharacterized protein n=1 Tax=Novosphingobium olei TaxID=2728851 RepID=A0A7Y0GCK0_9SPHN|nr:hypothetical protein [Novosphingobium olei]NML95692.1 hypothetical protein [Novosphingobium olei]